MRSPFPVWGAFSEQWEGARGGNETIQRSAQKEELPGRDGDDKVRILEEAQLRRTWTLDFNVWTFLGARYHQKLWAGMNPAQWSSFYLKIKHIWLQWAGWMVALRDFRQRPIRKLLRWIRCEAITKILDKGVPVRLERKAQIQNRLLHKNQ